MMRVKGCVKSYVKNNNDDGFSLLELVIAVGILAILSVVGLIAYNKITEHARKTAVDAAAADVLIGAAAYDANSDDPEAYKEAAIEWNTVAKKGDKNSITVEADKLNDGFCVKAEMKEYGLKAYRGAGCEKEGIVSPGDDDENNTGGSEDGNTGEIFPPATAAGCFEFAAGSITGYDVVECGTDVVIPNTINGEAVVGIGDRAFNNKGLTSVKFNEGLKTIGNYAFAYNYYSLTSVEFPSSLKSIGNHSFALNHKLSSVKFNEGLESIGDEAFSYDGLTGHVIIPGSVKSIGVLAFYGNYLNSVEFNEGLEIIGNRAFWGSGLSGHVEFPGSLKSIGTFAFFNTSLTSVKFNEGLEVVGEHAFYGNKITGSIDFPSSVKSIGDRAFVNNYDLKSVRVSSDTVLVELSFNGVVEIIRY